MNIIDLQPFCGKDHDLRSPMRCAYGIVATNRKIMICIRDDGRDAVLMPAPMQDKIAAIKSQLEATASDREWHDLSAILMPEHSQCLACDGSGRVYIAECNECDGVGEFKHGSHWYICENCNGNGEVNSKQPFHGSSQDICTACDGTGERSQLVLVSNCKLSNHDLSRLQALPECRIGVKSPTDTVAVTFNGGFGAVMPWA